MDLRPTLDKLEKSIDFLKWKGKNKHTYFSYAFKIPQEMQDDWHIGFYNKDKEKITTFVVTAKSIDIRSEEDVFKENEKDIAKIHMENVKLSFEEIMGKAREFQSDNFPKDRPEKTIAILQNLNSFGEVWNITYITESFNTLNMKLDPSSGKIKEHKVTSIFDFRAK